MSDYGFATKDPAGNVAINAKNPIFGFDMGHRPMAFKTFRFTDAKEPPIHTGNPGTPNPSGTGWSSGETLDGGNIVELVKKVKHGYNFRPVGYAVVTGTKKLSRRIQITQTQRSGTWGGNYTKTFNTASESYELTPNQFNKAIVIDTGFGFPGSVASLEPTDFSGTIWSYEYPKSVFCYGSPWGTELWNPKDTQIDEPMFVEFDDEYIYFYRQWSWSDSIRRCKLYSSYYGRVTDDIQERVKISASFVGSTFDVTVYLCPYPLKELL